jgi:D-alanyl-D-alanine carboxypeptidase (penicillin-binding protein 5/6)
MKVYKKTIYRLSFNILCGLLAGLLSATPCMADLQNPPQMATEYQSEDLMQNFESPDVIQVAATAEHLSISATGAILMERNSGQVLYEKNADQPRPPASITKVMTLLLAMEAIEKGKLALTDRITASAHACSMGGSQIWLEEGEIMTVDDLLKAICVASANDAAVALGEHIAGSEEAFVSQMNERAKKLGANNTNFVNCCGLDVENHYTTPRDIALISRKLLDYPLITEYSTIWMDSLRNGETQLVNTNKLVRFYEGATGLKTGTTDKAGYCVSATAKRNNMELIAVVLDGADSNKRFSDAKQLLNFGFANWELAKPNPQDTVIQDIPVCHGVAPAVSVVPETVTPFLVEKGQSSAITSQITLSESLQAPVSAGQVVGKITYLLEDKTVGECRLLAEQEIHRLTFPLALLKLLENLIKI